MRLTADLINASLSYINPLGERELGLRGHKIPAIENLGVAPNHDAIDFTDNDIPSLANFPLSPRLQTLLVARNRVNNIHPTLHKSLPNLSTLQLAGNRLSELADLDPLGHFAKLRVLTVLDNPVCRKEHYRAWLIWRVPTLRILDYQRIKDAERKDAIALFGSAENPTPLAQKIIASRSAHRQAGGVAALELGGGPNGDAPANGPTATGVPRYTEKEKARIRERIKNASSLAEMTKLEKMLATGTVPREMLDGDDGDAMEG